MNELKLILNTKNVRKVAFAVGFGLTMGKFAGDCVNAVFNGFAKAGLRTMAEKGNEFAQGCCDEVGVKYEAKEEKNDDALKGVL